MKKCYRFVDKNGNSYEKVDVKVEDKYDGEMLTFIIDDESDRFTDDEIRIIIKLLHRGLEYGGDYYLMKQYVELLDKLTEKIA